MISHCLLQPANSLPPADLRQDSFKTDCLSGLRKYEAGSTALLHFRLKQHRFEPVIKATKRLGCTSLVMGSCA